MYLKANHSREDSTSRRQWNPRRPVQCQFAHVPSFLSLPTSAYVSDHPVMVLTRLPIQPNRLLTVCCAVMTKKEQKLEEKMAKKHKKAVTMAKRTTPPLRSVPITKSTSVGVVAEGTQLVCCFTGEIRGCHELTLLRCGELQDEDVMEEAEEEAEEEEEIPLERKKEKIKKASGKTSSAATPTKTKDKKTKKTKKMEKGGKKHKGDKKKQ